MEHDSSRHGRHHQPVPAFGGHHFNFFEGEDSQSDVAGNEGFIKPTINLVWAQATALDGTPNALGYRGSLPWHVPEDMSHFVDLTVGHPIVMGRVTWESFGPHPSALPHRDNIVISSRPDYEAPGATVVDSLEEALRLAATPAIPDDGIDRTEIWVIGGGTVFKQCLGIADNAYVTILDVRVPADAFAPDMERLVQAGKWRVESSSPWAAPSGQEAAAEHRRVSVARYRFVQFARNEEHQA